MGCGAPWAHSKRRRASPRESDEAPYAGMIRIRYEGSFSVHGRIAANTPASCGIETRSVADGERTRVRRCTLVRAFRPTPAPSNAIDAYKHSQFEMAHKRRVDFAICNVVA